MDQTDLVSRVCILTKWDGDPETCRWDGRKLTGRSRKFHSKRCSTNFLINHFYRKVRVAARRRARGPCNCPNVKSHVLCQHCGVCEGELKKNKSRLECNHIIPLEGDRSAYSWNTRTFSCKNHLDNVEMLCRSCHLKVTRQQRQDRKKP